MPQHICYDHHLIDGGCPAAINVACATSTSCIIQDSVGMYTRTQTSADAQSYRGVHLTSNVAKVIERAALGAIPRALSPTTWYGPQQYAYSKGRGCRDALLTFTLRILSAFLRRQKVGTYFADVAGAFDRVSSERLLWKLKTVGAGPRFQALAKAWLRK